MVAVKNHMVFIHNDGILKACQVLEFQDQLACRLGNDLFVNEQGRNRDDFQFQLQLFGFDTKHDSVKPVSQGFSKALLNGSQIDPELGEKTRNMKMNNLLGDFALIGT